MADVPTGTSAEENKVSMTFDPAIGRDEPMPRRK
jgi:hypothetical protein